MCVCMYKYVSTSYILWTAVIGSFIGIETIIIKYARLNLFFVKSQF